MESAVQYLVTATTVWWTAKKKDFRLKKEQRNSPLPKKEITATSTPHQQRKEEREGYAPQQHRDMPLFIHYTNLLLLNNTMLPL